MREKLGDFFSGLSTPLDKTVENIKQIRGGGESHVCL